MEAAGVGNVGVVVDVLAAAFAAIGAAVVDIWRRAQAFHDVSFGIGPVGVGQQPEGGPGAHRGRQLGPHFEVAVLLRETAQGVEHAGGVFRAPGRIVGVAHRRLGGDGDDPACDGERIDADVLFAAALKARRDIGLALAVGHQGVGPLVLQVVAEICCPRALAGRGVVERKAVEIVRERGRAELGAVQLQKELAVDERCGRCATEREGFAAGQGQDRVGPDLAHVAAHICGRAQAIAQQLDLGIAVPIVDHVAAVAGLDLEAGALGLRADQHVVTAQAVHPLAAIDDDQVAEVIADRIVEVHVDDEVLDVRRQLQRQPADHGVDAPADRFLDAIHRAGDEDAVVAGRADQQVAATLARNRNIARAGRDGFVADRCPDEPAAFGAALRHRNTTGVEIGHLRFTLWGWAGWPADQYEPRRQRTAGIVAARIHRSSTRLFLRA